MYEGRIEPRLQRIARTEFNAKPQSIDIYGVKKYIGGGQKFETSGTSADQCTASGSGTSRRKSR